MTNYEKIRGLGINMDIRGDVWETNSSLSHSMVILSKKDYDRWRLDNLYLYDGGYGSFYGYKKPECNHLYTEEEVKEFLKSIDEGYRPELTDNSDITIIANNWGFETYDMWNENEDYEDEAEYTTESGEEIVVRCAYGYDG